MQKKIDFHRRDTEDTEDIDFAFKVNRMNINEHIPSWEPSRRNSIFYPIPPFAGLDKKDNKLSAFCYCGELLVQQTTDNEK